MTDFLVSAKDTLTGPGILVMAIWSLVVVSRFAFAIVGRMERYSLTHEMVRNDNPAVGIRYAFFTLAVVISFLGIIHPSGVNFQEDLNTIAFYGLLAIGLLIISRWINDFLILYGFNNNQEVVGEKNTAVAIVEGATYLATAFILSGALSGWEGGIEVALIWFGIGQALLVVFAFFYRLIVSGVFEALDNHNHACALSFGGFMLSLGIALGAAVSGSFTGWIEELLSVAQYMFFWLLLMAMSHFVTDIFILPAARLRDEVIKDQNVAAGAIAATIMLVTTLIFVRVW